MRPLRKFGRNTLSSASLRVKNEVRQRSAHFEQLEDRTLLLAVGVTSSIPVAREGTDTATGVWRIERDSFLSSELSIPIKLSGTASWNDDYRLFDFASSSEITLTSVYDSETNLYEYYSSVVLPVGESYVELELRAIPDLRQETTENAQLTLLPPNEIGLIGSGSASIDIVDSDSWLVQIETVDSVATEGTTADCASFTVSRTGVGSLDSPLVVKFELSGSADPGSDYLLIDANGMTVALSRPDPDAKYIGRALIPAGQTAATLQLHPNNDSFREDVESVVVNLIAENSGTSNFYNVGQNAAASASIFDNDSWIVDVTALDSTGSETNAGETPDPLAFRITRMGESDASHALTVWFGVGGTVDASDFSVGSNCRYDEQLGLWSTTLPAGEIYVDITINVVNDSECESTETFLFYLVEKPENAASSCPEYDLGVDFYAYAQILDSDSWTIDVATNPADGAERSAYETSASVGFTFTRAGVGNLESALTVYYELSGNAVVGKDYDAPEDFVGNCGYITIPVGQTSATLNINVVDDRIIEGTESIVLRVLEEAPAPFGDNLNNNRYTLGENYEAVASILDDELYIEVSVSALDPVAYETTEGSVGNSGAFRITRNSSDLSAPLETRYELRGTAENGSDYASLSGIATIPAGANYVDVTVAPFNDEEKEALETVVASIIVDETLPTPYLCNSNSATLFLIDSNPLGELVVPERGTLQLTAFEELEALGWTVEWNLDGDAFFGETTGGALRGYELGSTVTYNAAAFTASADESANIKPVAVRVRKDGLIYSYATTLVVQNVAPQASIEAPSSANVGQSIRISGTVTDPGADSFTYYVLYGDEAPDYVPTPISMHYRSYATAHRYSAQGWYDVRVTVDDGKGESTTSKRVKVGNPQAVAFYCDSNAEPLTSGGASGVLKANRFDSNGDQVDPEFNEDVYCRFRVVNHGNETITFDVDSITLPENVELASAFPSALEPDESACFLLRWSAKAPLNSSVAIPTSDPTTPWFTLPLSGYVQPYALPDVEFYLDGSAAALRNGESNVLFTSIRRNDDGTFADANLNEAIYRRFRIINRSDETIYFDDDSLTTPVNVSVVGTFPSSLAPNEERYVAFKWIAREELDGAISLTAQDSPEPVFSFSVSGDVQDYAAPTISDVSLLYDSDVPNDNRSFNSAIQWVLSGDFAMGRVDVEFDLDSDGISDGAKTCYAPGSCSFDPSALESWTATPTESGQNVAIRYRVVHYDDRGELLSTDLWRSFSFVLLPAPTSNVVVSDLAVSSGWAGGWSAPNGVRLTGTLSDESASLIEISVDGQSFTQRATGAAFSVELPYSFQFGETTTIQARAVAYDSTYQCELTGAWSTLRVTPSLPEIMTQGEKALTFGATESGVGLCGALVGIGAEFCEVEISQLTQENGVEVRRVLGSAWTDEKGEFFFAPRGLRATSGTLAARAVYRRDDACAYGNEATVEYYYALSADTTELALAMPSANDPAFEISTAVAKEKSVSFEYRWKRSGDTSWSNVKSVLAVGDSSISEEQEKREWSGTFSIAALYASTATLDVEIEARAKVYDEILGEYAPCGEWRGFSFSYEPQVFSAASIASLTIDDARLATLSGSIASGSSTSGVIVKFYASDVYIGQTTTDENGAFSYRLTGLTPGDVELTARTSQWNPRTRSYVSGVPTNVSFVYSPGAVAVTAPTLAVLKLWDDTGLDYDSVTANAAIYGKIDASDGESNAYLLVEYDVDSDGTPDGWTRADADGEFLFTPTLTEGRHTISVRVARWNDANASEVFGVWQSVTMTYEIPSVLSAPSVRNLTLESSRLDSQGRQVTQTPSLNGTISSESGYENIRVEYEVLEGGNESGVITVAPNGKFCLNPELTANDETQVVLRVRAGRYDADANSATWGEWTTKSFLYQTPSESVLLAHNETASDRANANVNERKVMGIVSKGVGIDSYYVEFDLDGDGIADGRSIPNSSDEYTYYFTPCSETISIRVVDVMPDGSTRTSSQNWTSVRTYFYDSEPGQTTLGLYFTDSSSYKPYLQAFNASSPITVSLDYDYDGQADAYATTNRYGQITHEALVAALSDAGVVLKEGFSIVSVKPTGSVDALETPAPLLTNVDFATLELDSENDNPEILKYKSFVASMSTLLDYDPLGSPSVPKREAPTFDEQTTKETAPATQELTVGAQSDWNVLQNTPIPAIEFPTFVGEDVDFGRDVLLLERLTEIEEAYAADIQEAQSAFRATQARLQAKYVAAVSSAWNEYSLKFANKTLEYAAKDAETWEGSQKRLALQNKLDDALTDLSDNFAAESASLERNYNDQISAIVEATGKANPDSYDWNLEPGGWQTYKTYRQALLRASGDYERAKLSLSEEYQSKSLKLQAQYASQLAEGELAFEKEKNESLAKISKELSKLGKDYEDACADALYEYYAGVPELVDETTGIRSEATPGLADANETYRNAAANAARRASQDSWNTIVNAVSVWKNDEDTPSVWGEYLSSLYDYAETNRGAYSDAYVAETEASAAARKAFEIAQVAARRQYLKDAAQSVYTKEINVAQETKTLKDALAKETIEAALSVKALEIDEFTTQIELILASQIVRANEYQALTEPLVSAYVDALSGVNVDYYSMCDVAMRVDSTNLLAKEVALYEQVLQSAQRLETGTLLRDAQKENALWQALGEYRKEMVDIDSQESKGAQQALELYTNALNAAEHIYLQAELTADGVYQSALDVADAAQAEAEETLTQNTTRQQYDAYFTALSDACSAMANVTVGGFYGAAVAAAQACFTSRNSAVNAFVTSITTKVNDFAQSVRNAASSYLSSIFDAFFSATEPTPTDVEEEKVVAAKKAQIDAETKCRKAIVEANYEKSISVSNANADSVLRTLDFTKKYGDYELENHWYPGGVDVSMPLGYNVSKGLYYYGFAGVDSGTFSGISAAESLPLGNDSYYLLGRLSTLHMASPVRPATDGALRAFNSVNASIVVAQKKDAELKYDYDAAIAYQTYVDVYSSKCADETEAELAIARLALSDDLTAETALKNAELAARSAALNSYITAYRNADYTSDFLSLSGSTLGADSLCLSSLSDAYGDLQVANRQRMSDSVTPSDGRATLYASAVFWAREMKSLRNQRNDAAVAKELGYNDAISSYYTTYAGAVNDAQEEYANSGFNVTKTLETNFQAANVAYAYARFDAAQAKILAELNATITKNKANAALEAEFAYGRYSDFHTSIQTALTSALDAIASVVFEPQTPGASQGSSVASTLSSVVVNVDGYTPSEEYSDARLAQKKVRVENAYQDALKAAKAQYDNAIRDAWNEMFLSDLGSSAVAEIDYSDLVSTLEAALDSASSAYRSAAFAEYGAALADFDMIDQIARYQQSRVDMGLSVPSDAFANLDDPDFEYQVCFAAGTLVHMADGSKKPIETIRPNDIVLASDHRNPESKPVPARVVRFFDNGLKEVVRLRFEGGEEIVCTPGHRFYVVGKGWKGASELTPEDYCLNSSGEGLLFVRRELLTDKVAVYNLEVEEYHSYYVGSNNCALVHNDCMDTLSMIYETYKGFSRGICQGIANTFNGAQDIIVETVNLGIGGVNKVVDVSETVIEECLSIELNDAEKIRIPKIHSPDWSRGLISDEYDNGYIDSHAVSKFIGGQSLVTLATLGASRFNVVGGQLRHYTSEGGLRGIKESNEIASKFNQVYALQGDSFIPVQLRALLGQTACVVEISPKLYNAFRPVPPTGIARMWTWMNGGVVANVESLNLATSAVTHATPVITSGVLLDLVAGQGVFTGYHMLINTDVYYNAPDYLIYLDSKWGIDLYSK